MEILQRAVVDEIRDHHLVLEELCGGVAGFMDECVANFIDPIRSRVVLRLGCKGAGGFVEELG